MAGGSSWQGGWMVDGPSPGSPVAGYVVESRIGAGGMAVVFRARDERLNRTVALKVLTPALAGDDEFRERFIRESRAAATVDHPHIIPVYAAGEADGVLYIAMRFVAGGDLRSLVYREGPLPAARAAAFISAVASALDAAHAAGLVHRDVKPANILVDASPGRADHPYLSDFGLSKGAASAAGLTGPGQFMGTPDYCAPEQISGKPVSAAADQYALACVAYTMLAGTMPFARDEPMAVLWAHLSDPPPPLAGLRPDLPRAVDQVLGTALAKAPHDRYPSCGEFASALRAALQASAPPPPTPRAAATRPPTTTHAAAPSAATMPSQSSSTPAWSDVVTAAAENTAKGTAQGRHIRTPLGRPRKRAAIGLAAVLLTAAAVTAATLLLQPAPARHPAATAPRTTTHPPTTPAEPPGNPHLIATLVDPTSTGVLSVAFGPNGTVDTVDQDGNAYVFDIATQRTTATLTGLGGILTPDGATVIVPAGHCTASTPACEGVVDITTRREIAILPKFLGEAVSTGDDTLAATDAERDGAQVWNVRSGTLLATVTDPDRHFVVATALSPNGKVLATSGSQAGSHSIYLWNTDTQAMAATVTVPDGMGGSSSLAFPGSGPLPANPGVSVALDRAGKRVALSDGTATYIYDVDTRHRVAALPGALGAFSPDGKLMVGFSTVDNYNQLWNVPSHKLITTFTGPDVTNLEGNTPTAFAFSNNSSELAIADGNGNIYVYDVAGL